jgi:4-hydroxy-tetrahydrodipicolinate reductase
VDAGVLAGVGSLGVAVSQDLKAALTESRSTVLVDFTVAGSALTNIEIALRAGVASVVGTTGLTASDLERVGAWTEEAGTPALVAPNFAIGAVLMMQFAAQAAAYLPDAEIIELHHEKKVDSPSGTALLTAQKIRSARTGSPATLPGEPVEKLPGARGAEMDGIRIHSVRLPGYVAHQEVIFGGLGQTLAIRHDSTDRRSFMPGVLLAIRKVRSLQGLTIGLEQLLGA